MQDGEMFLKNLFQYRRYILRNAWNEFRYRYAGTGMGIFWNLVHPMFEILVYTVVFSWLLQRNVRGVPYILYLTSGLLVWRSFSETVRQGSNAFVANSRYLKRLSIPSEIFVARIALSSLFMLFIYYILVMPVNLVLGNVPGPQILLLPVLLIFSQLLALGMALILANLRPLFPDVGEIVQAILPLWFWGLPIIYPETVLPEHLRPLFYLNPPYAFLKSVRGLILESRVPSLPIWGIMAGWLVLFLWAGAGVNRKLRSEVREVI